jgi:hypothetical protein
MKSREFLRKSKTKTRKHRKNSSISSIDPASNQQPGKPAKIAALMPPAIPNVSSQQVVFFIFIIQPP